jgi:hypothetical protein
MARHRQRANPHLAKMQIETQNNFARIDAINFFGQYCNSADGTFVVAWETAGRFVLFENSKQILKGEVKSPSDGHVANNGRFFIISQQSPPGDAPLDAFLCFDKFGKLLASGQLHAAIVNSSISETGKFAVFQSAVSDNEDSMQLIVYDVDAKTILWQTEWGPHWARAYSFDETSKKLTLIYPELGSYEFGSDGSFLSGDRWEIDQVKLSYGKELNQIVEYLVSNNFEAAKGNRLLQLLNERSQERWFQNNPKDKSFILRSIGEVQLAMGQKAQALETWERSVSLNPKIGLQRKLENLKKLPL